MHFLELLDLVTLILVVESVTLGSAVEDHVLAILDADGPVLGQCWPFLRCVSGCWDTFDRSIRVRWCCLYCCFLRTKGLSDAAGTDQTFNGALQRDLIYVLLLLSRQGRRLLQPNLLISWISCRILLGSGHVQRCCFLIFIRLNWIVFIYREVFLFLEGYLLFHTLGEFYWRLTLSCRISLTLVSLANSGCFEVERSINVGISCSPADLRHTGCPCDSQCGVLWVKNLLRLFRQVLINVCFGCWGLGVICNALAFSFKHILIHKLVER